MGDSWVIPSVTWLTERSVCHPIVVWKQSFSSSKTSSIIDNGFGLVGTNPLLSWQENVIAYLKEALVLFSIPSDGPFVCAYVWLASITTTRTICIPSCIGEIRGPGGYYMPFRFSEIRVQIKRPRNGLLQIRSHNLKDKPPPEDLF